MYIRYEGMTVIFLKGNKMQAYSVGVWEIHVEGENVESVGRRAARVWKKSREHKEKGRK